MKRLLLIIISTLGLLCYSINAVEASIININGRTNSPSNPVSEFFSAGTYEISAIGPLDGGVFTAINPWSTPGGNPDVSGCDSSGGNCTHGWMWFLYFSTPELGEKVIPALERFAAPVLALDNEQQTRTTEFTLLHDATVQFFIRDPVFSDNHGGVSIDVTSVPLPPAILFFGSSIIALIGMRKNL